jgi:hypothetical protein
VHTSHPDIERSGRLPGSGLPSRRHTAPAALAA